jgi:hypothetical protein
MEIKNIVKIQENFTAIMWQAVGNVRTYRSAHCTDLPILALRGSRNFLRLRLNFTINNLIFLILNL